jgi:membrane-anchored protein YejM (alkaline phosphatase superfamily)
MTKMNYFKNIFLAKTPFFVKFILQLYMYGVLLFSILRLMLLLYVADDSICLLSAITLKSFLIGLQFDNVIMAYVLAIPLILMYFQSVFNIYRKYISIFITIYLCIIFPAILFLTIADIPYFKFFKNRISESSLQWLGNIDIVLKMILENTVNILFLLFSLIICGLTIFFIVKFCSKKFIQPSWDSNNKYFNTTRYSFYFLLLGFFTFLGMRGTLTHPIRHGDAFYCNNPILNQIGLNPVFTLMKSFSDKVSLMDNNLAIKNTRELLQISSKNNLISPIAREVINDSLMIKHNIVIVLMEGMSANFMKTFGNQNNLTPTLDSLAKISMFFKNSYSAGIHTNNGIFSSLFSFPALKRVRPMSTIPLRKFSGIPFVLKENGYENIFFCSHSESFDNLGSFMPHNSFDQLYTSEDFPTDKIIGPYGVPDDYLFSASIEKLNEIYAAKPFFATILTTSNHDPYILPDYFKSPIKDKELKAVSYADWSINTFITKAKKCKWFDNTIFVFVSDHGRVVGKNSYDLVLSYNHIPIIIYAPSILTKPKEYNNFTGQIDIFPTLMGLLHTHYINNTLGVDAINQKRDCMYFSADNKIGCINSKWLYVYRFDGSESLYEYTTNNKQDFSMTNKTELAKLKKYALSQTQTAEWMISNDKTSLKIEHRK